MKKKQPPPSTVPEGFPMPDSLTFTALKARFGTSLSHNTLVMLHRVSYWERTQITELVEDALQLLFASDPKLAAAAATQLPSQEQRKRKLPYC